MQHIAEVLALKPAEAPPGTPFSIDLTEFVESLAQRIDGFLYRGLNSGDYAMLWVSSGFEAMIGTRAELFIAERRPFSDLIHPEDLPAVNEAVAAALASGGRWQVFYRVRGATGQFRYVLETGGGCRPDPVTGEVRYLDGIILDAGKMTDLAGRLEQGGTVVSAVAASVANIVETLRTLRLLALNARIEAARSGEHGAGFGVVAQEMVALADRGDEITNRIKGDLARLSEAVRI